MSVADLPGGALEWLRWLIRRRRHFVVRGLSMQPLLDPGDHILVDPDAYRHRVPAVGDVVVAKHPFMADKVLVKRVARVAEDGRCFLVGDNPHESTDSHALGALRGDLVLGRVTRRIP